jgi:hypothetical protein
MPRKVNHVNCVYCRKPIDSRGWKVHSLTCKSRPPEASDIGHITEIESGLRQGNLSVLSEFYREKILLDYYREGLSDGMKFAGKKAA